MTQYEKRCQGTQKDGKPCRALLGVFTKLSGSETIVCRRCGFVNHFCHAQISDRQYINGERAAVRD